MPRSFSWGQARSVGADHADLGRLSRPGHGLYHFSSKSMRSLVACGKSGSKERRPPSSRNRPLADTHRSDCEWRIRGPTPSCRESGQVAGTHRGSGSARLKQSRPSGRFRYHQQRYNPPSRPETRRCCASTSLAPRMRRQDGSGSRPHARRDWPHHRDGAPRGDMRASARTALRSTVFQGLGFSESCDGKRSAPRACRPGGSRSTWRHKHPCFSDIRYGSAKRSAARSWRGRAFHPPAIAPAPPERVVRPRR